MSLGEMPDQYVATLTVTDLPWSRQRLITEFGGTPGEARPRLEAAAQAQGWTPPGAWQWWRRKDSKAPFESTCL
ncbi:hypothetical protein RBE51_22265 [Pseudomonas taiwanensis]|uniref:hypothetical protein n=1 Tax=Pseudomonas taiwanensis TaxID=470150 RepID=UPI0028E00261|nr:hypothetical protein [Pseudomonas taiwanensis]MDT8925513.1 hypothetical protein [Pseudomonas taiwanensis]